MTSRGLAGSPKSSVTRRRRFQKKARVVTETGGRGKVVGFYHHGEYLVLIDGTDLPMRYMSAELSPEVHHLECDMDEDCSCA